MAKGLIFTDTKRLAEKFSVSKEDVLCEIVSFMQFRAKQGVEYGLLDIDSSGATLRSYYRNGITDIGKSCTPCLKTESKWEGYADCLDNYDISSLFGITDKKLQTIFIIGGNDVIPVPSIPNFNEERGIRMNLESDMPYTLDIRSYGHHGRYNWDDIKKILSKKPKYNISRLPIPEGKCEISILTSYFEKIKDAISSRSELSCKKATCIACNATKEVANRIMAHTSTILGVNNVSKHLSPQMDINKPSQVKKLLKDAPDSDMLVFVLHGSSRPGESEYAGHIDVKEPVGPIAFSPNNLKEFERTRIIAGLCCWGARYIGYSTDDSMLLTALNKLNAISFLGASSSVAGGFDCRIKLNGDDISYGEKLLQYYVSLITDGTYTAEALTKARYLTTRKYLSLKSTMKLRTALTTMFEFGVYGDPFLTTSETGSKESVDVILADYQREYEDRIAKENGTLNAIRRDAKIALGEISFEVNGVPQETIERICKKVANDFGCKVEPLVSMYYDNINETPKYSFVFKFKNDNEKYDQDIIVYSDMNGDIDDVHFMY